MMERMFEGWRVTGVRLVVGAIAGWVWTGLAAVDKKGEEKRQTWEEFMTVDLNAPVRELPPLADADARRAAFAERFSPAAVEQAAKALFAVWDFNERKSSKNPATREFDAEKKRAVSLFQEKKYAESLEAYRSYLISKTTVLWNTEPNSSGNAYRDRIGNPILVKRYADVVNLLMRDIYQTCTTKTTVHIGEQG